ncbi:MAG: hypothetical protein AAF623_11590, partial [Planctomycetota bacterium]
MKIRKTAKYHITTGLVCLVVSLNLAAVFMGLVPDRATAVRMGRAAIAEVAAIDISDHVGHGKIEKIKADLDLILERNEDLLSAAVRRNNTAVATSGDHQLWEEMDDEYSTDWQIRIPIYSAGEDWGWLEMRFQREFSFPFVTPGQTQVMILL